MTKVQQILNKLEDRNPIHFQRNQNLEDQDDPLSTDQYLIDIFLKNTQNVYVLMG